MNLEMYMRPAVINSIFEEAKVVIFENVNLLLSVAFWNTLNMYLDLFHAAEM